MLLVLELIIYSLSGNRIVTLDGFVIPNGLQYLELVFFVLLVFELIIYSLAGNQIAILDGCVIPNGLGELELVLYTLDIRIDKIQPGQ